MVGRGLTSGEEMMLRSVFGSTIDYRAVWVHKGKWAFFQPGDTAMTPNGEMYWPDAKYETDFSLGNLHKRGWFIHEGAHLYQHYKLKWNVVARALVERNYDYVLDPAKTKFSDYGLEEMGDIAEDFYALRQGARIKRKYVLADYAKLLPLP